MGFGKRMTTKARAWVRAFFAPRRSRVVNSNEKEGLRKTGVVVQQRAIPEPPLRVLGATRALRPRHNENDPVFDKIRQIHGLIPQIHAFFRQIQDPSERGKKYQIIENKKIMGIKGRREGVFRAAAASARIRPHLRPERRTPRRLWREPFLKAGGSRTCLAKPSPPPL